MEINPFQAGIDHLKPHLIIIDCRFGYEFRGGHIKGAINISDPKVIEYLFIDNHHLFQNNEFLEYINTFKDLSINSVRAEIIVKSFAKYLHESKNSLKRNKVHIKTQEMSYRLYTSTLLSSALNTSNYMTLPKPNRKRFETSIDTITVKKGNSKEKTMKTRRMQKKPSQPTSKGPNLTIVLYCEFSSKRAPDIYNHLRGMDRKANASVYPKLYYDDIFLLEKGYSGYVKRHKQFCTGIGGKYIEMNDAKFGNEFKNAHKLLAKQWESYNNIPSVSNSKHRHLFKAFTSGENRLLFNYF